MQPTTRLMHSATQHLNSGAVPSRPMNLLVTNTQEEQAYLILRCLRHEAKRIVITVPEGSVFSRWSGISAWSRHVSRRYTVPDCTAEWRAGRIRAENTPAEEHYMQRIEEICVREQIDVIFPSYDAEVMVFAKNRARLAEQGILAIVPDYKPLARIIDKARTLEAARAVGFPTPASCIPENEAELLDAAGRLNPPWVLKPRCNAHGANIHRLEDVESLRTAFAELAAIQPRPLLQECVPVGTKRNYYLMVTPDFEVVSVHSPQIHRHRVIGVRTPCAVAETTDEVPLLDEVKALVRELGVWGAMTVQTIVSQHDGVPRLMEINPRFGHNLWYRTEFGVNEPLIYLRMVEGKPLPEIPRWPAGVLLLDPLWDLLQLYLLAVDRAGVWLRRRLGRNGGNIPGQSGESVRDLMRTLKSEYFGPSARVTNPLNRGLLSDPLPPLVRIGRTVLFEWNRRRAVKRERK
ncbi:ATP-grasp domain-containing protein [Elongatibacter sediminis]|uniref:ATP-grasp domain-containing protein n=1 Tax=Elongatibacter sediminis TaxID=3119006 RepID=A0AAW9R9N0_9GAMM